MFSFFFSYLGKKKHELLLDSRITNKGNERARAELGCPAIQTYPSMMRSGGCSASKDVAHTTCPPALSDAKSVMKIS